MFLTSRDRKGNWAKHVNDVWPGVHDGNEERVLGPGELAFVPTGVEHGHSTFGGEPVELLDIDCYEDTEPVTPGSLRKTAPETTRNLIASSRPRKATSKPS